MQRKGLFFCRGGALPLIFAPYLLIPSMPTSALAPAQNPWSRYYMLATCLHACHLSFFSQPFAAAQSQPCAIIIGQTLKKRH
jgi:hypothetical protein